MLDLKLLIGKPMQDDMVKQIINNWINSFINK